MTAADEYQRVMRPILDRHEVVTNASGSDWDVLLADLAQALAADPGVRAAVEREALERAAQAIEAVFADPDRIRPQSGPLRTDLATDAEWCARIVRDLMLQDTA